MSIPVRNVPKNRVESIPKLGMSPVLSELDCSLKKPRYPSIHKHFDLYSVVTCADTMRGDVAIFKDGRRVQFTYLHIDIYRPRGLFSYFLAALFRLEEGSY